MVLFVYSILLTRRPDEETQPGSSRTVVAQAPFMALAGYRFLLLLAIFYMPLVGGESLCGQYRSRT